jgi:hypothetical protein
VVRSTYCSSRGLKSPISGDSETSVILAPEGSNTFGLYRYLHRCRYKMNKLKCTGGGGGGGSGKERETNRLTDQPTD